MDYKTLPFEIKEADPEKGIITGYAASFGNTDDGLDKIHPGAFTKTLAERGHRIKACYAHDMTKLVGVPIVIREDERGLYTETKLALRSFWGKEVYELAMTEGPQGQRALDEMSIGYSPVIASFDPDTTIRDLRELKLYEYSYVPLGMNDQANVIDAKSLIATLQGKDIDTSPEFVAAVVNGFAELKAGRVLSGKNREIISKAHNALAALLDATEPDASKGAHHSGIDSDARAAMLRGLQLRKIASAV